MTLIEVFRTKKAVHTEEWIPNADGEKRLIAIAKTPKLDVNGNVEYVVCAGTDITEKKRLEEESREIQKRLHQAEKAESLSRMAGAVAHLFNNQLTVVIGNLELLEEDLPPDARISESLDEAKQAAQRAAETGGLLLTFLGRSPGRPKPLDLARACRERLSGLQFRIHGSARITVALPEPGPTVRVDPARLDQIVDALVVNAAEALDGDGEVRLSVCSVAAGDIPDRRRMPLEWTPSMDRYACLAVENTGCGMDKDKVEKIFDPFFSDKFTGRGTGLPVALGIVNSAGGCMTVDSVPGKGSTFQVFFPLSEEKNKSWLSAPDVQFGGRQASVKVD